MPQMALPNEKRHVACAVRAALLLAVLALARATGGDPPPPNAGAVTSPSRVEALSPNAHAAFGALYLPLQSGSDSYGRAGLGQLNSPLNAVALAVGWGLVRPGNINRSCCTAPKRPAPAEREGNPR